MIGCIDLIKNYLYLDCQAEFSDIQWNVVSCELWDFLWYFFVCICLGRALYSCMIMGPNYFWYCFPNFLRDGWDTLVLTNRMKVSMPAQSHVFLRYERCFDRIINEVWVWLRFECRSTWSIGTMTTEAMALFHFMLKEIYWSTGLNIFPCPISPNRIAHLWYPRMRSLRSHFTALIRKC